MQIKEREQQNNENMIPILSNLENNLTPVILNNREEQTIEIKNQRQLDEFKRKHNNISKEITLDLSEYSNPVLNLNNIEKIQGNIIFPENVKVVLLNDLTSVEDLKKQENSILPDNLIGLYLDGLKDTNGLTDILDNLNDLQVIGLNGLTSLEDDLKYKLNEMIQIKDKDSVLSSIELRGIDSNYTLIESNKNIQGNTNGKDIMIKGFDLENTGAISFEFKDKSIISLNTDSFKHIQIKEQKNENEMLNRLKESNAPI